MGSKIEAKRRMQDSGVSVLPSIAVGALDARRVARQSGRLGPGHPGQGLGRRWRARHGASTGAAADLYAAVEAAKREALSAFGDETVFLEPYVDARAISRCRSLATRTATSCICSTRMLDPAPASEDRRGSSVARARRAFALGHLQCGGAGRRGNRLRRRRHRRVFAGPRPAILFPGSQYAAASRTSRDRGDFGARPVRLQILVAQGYALPPEVWQAKPCGHAIEVRLYAEDPAQHFAPSTGMLRRFASRRGLGVRVDRA